jgi:DNA-directed RNA polymerase specialized sigma24 family protein
MAVVPSIDDSDERLAEALQNSNQEALNVLYDRYAGVLLGLLQKITNNKNMAEEALQNCFVSVWRNRDFYSSSSERLFTWILKIARETAGQMIEGKGLGSENQKSSLYVDGNENEKQGQAPSIMEMILFGNITQEEAALKLGVSKVDLRLMLRKEINKLRGI